jgi:hypothetical protein
LDQLFLTLFNQAPGTASATMVALDALGLLLTGVALLVLARRNDLGWWVQLLAAFAGPMIIALQFGQEGLFKAIPVLAVGIFGLWRFSKYPLVGKFHRSVQVRGFSAGSLVWGFILVVLLTALTAAPSANGLAVASIPVSFWLAFAFYSIVPAALVGIANGFRWAWLAIPVAAAGQIAVFFGNNPGLATLAALVLQVGAGIFGWWSWRQLPAEATTADADARAYPPSPYKA